MSAMNVKSNEMVGPLGSADKNKQWQRELLMERLRTHSAQNKTFAELSKAMRMSMLEKRYSLDPTERGSLQKCLDSMQHCIKVTTRQGLIERLESLSRQLGLKFTEEKSVLFISSEMFFLEIVLDATGTLSDVKVHHESKTEQQSQSCSELVACLLKGDFADFTAQLEGLSSIYQFNAEQKVKSMAFVAMQEMEKDLYCLYAAQNFHKDTQTVLLESSVGIVQKRRGGHPMKLTYFVSPYDLLSLENKTLMPLSIDVISTRNIGMSVTVNLEASNPNMLQIKQTVVLNADGQNGSVPVFSPITPANSTVLPATFVLRLNKSIPICDSLVEAIMETTEQNVSDAVEKKSLMQLVVQTASNGSLRNSNKGLFVTLPDQNHCYFFTENTRLKGYVISNIPYTEPSHVPKILHLLRQQALFYTLLASCVRPESKMGDLESTTMLEVSAINIHQISVGLEHPFEESMATIEFDLKDAANIDCRIYSLTSNYDAIAIKLTKIIQKTLSIPITIRALLKFWDQEQMKGFHRGGNGLDNGNFNSPLGPNDPGGRMNDYRDMKPKCERNMNGGFGIGAAGGNRQFFHASAVMMGGPTEAFASDTSVNMFDTSNHFTMKMVHDGGSGFDDAKENVGGEDFYKSPKSKTDLTMNQNSSETSDSGSLGTSTPTSDLGVASNLSLRKVSHHDSDSSSPYVDGDSSRNSMNEIVTEVKQKTPPKLDKTLPEEWRRKNSTIDSNVSITPVTSSALGFNSVLSGMGLERRPGIEIIPITATTTQSLPTSITITPITTSSSKSDRKSSSSRKYDEKSRSEKKRKRRKEDSPSMGPPDKMSSKQDGVNRSSVSVSIKSTDGTSFSSSEILRKISNAASKILTSGSSGRPSPKNSPSHISPKHLSSSTNSPKPGHSSTSSPKHSSSSTSVGKPSMSALKSATNSSPKSEKHSSKSSSFREKDRDRDKDRSGSNRSSSGNLSGTVSGVGSPKLKPTTVKLKQIDLSAALLPPTDHFTFDEATESQLGVMSCSGIGIGKQGIGVGGGFGIMNKVRKSSLSAVIDKLKSAQHPGDDLIIGNVGQHSSDGLTIREKLGGGSGNKTIYSPAFNHSVKSTSCPGMPTPANSLQSSQNSEYMIKPSLDGMKITINKTRSKDSPSSSNSTSNNSKNPSSFSKIFSSSGGGSGSSSPKRHTGLKPGVNSGPASKKSQSNQLSSAKSCSSGPQSHLTVAGRGNFQKSSSSGNLSSSSSSSKSSSPYASSKSLSSSALASATEPPKKDKVKNRNDASDVMKMLGFPSPMEGFMKSLNTKFQIPKLSARTTGEDSKKADPNRVHSGSVSATVPMSTSPSTVAVTTATASIVTTSSTTPPKTSGNISPAAVAVNESSRPFAEIFPKDVQAKCPFGMSKLPLEATSQAGNVVVNNTFNNVFNKMPAIFASNSNPMKFPPDQQGRNTKSPLSSYSTVGNSGGQKELLKTFPSLSPTVSPPITPVSSFAMISPPPPYSQANSVTIKSISGHGISPVRGEAGPGSVVTSLVSNRQSCETMMGPPSAQPASNVVIDMSKSTLSESDMNSNPDTGNTISTPSSIRPLVNSEPVALGSESSCAATPASIVRKLNSNTLVPQHKINFPASPSVSLHIVKSPVPSPLMVLPSPHSNSPCITDDELMDEALVGIGSK